MALTVPFLAVLDSFHGRSSTVEVVRETPTLWVTADGARYSKSTGKRSGFEVSMNGPRFLTPEHEGYQDAYAWALMEQAQSLAARSPRGESLAQRQSLESMRDRLAEMQKAVALAERAVALKSA